MWKPHIFCEEDEMKTVVSLVSAVLAFAPAPSAWAQEYPSKPIRLIVPFAPGGGADIVARAVAQRVSDSFRRSVVVDNRAGGGGTLGTEMVVRANPDGYTLIMISGSYGTNAAFYKLPYDSVNDIQPIIMIGEGGFAVGVKPTTPIKSVKELIGYAKANPGKLNYGSAGTGSTPHLAAELFKVETKVNLTHIPYKSMGLALNELIGGEIDLTFGTIVAMIPYAKLGRVRIIGVTTAKRSSVLPDIPTVSETVAGYEVASWFGLLGPKGLSKEIVTRWNKEVTKILQTDEMKGRMAREGLEPAGGPPEQFLSYIRREVEKWRKLVKEAKVTAES
ncbi:MAG: tripartite tricarboxylate transporter substrate binding protein [Betaproteobacteria bacterium]|nr:tripartite tricarboxylate transporter substrate binding protein [Betaproteobacteria bacterium]